MILAIRRDIGPIFYYQLVDISKSVQYCTVELRYVL